MKLTGQYNTATIFTDDIEVEALYQIKSLCDDPSFKNSKIAVMPDVHAGKGCTIGTTMTLPDYAVVPNHVGVDIGCGVTAYRLADKEIDYARVEEVITKYIPSGFNIRSEVSEKVDLITQNIIAYLNFLNEKHLPAKKAEEIFERAKLSYGTLGGGNHFIEIDENSDTGEKILVVHTGSRQLGNKCCQFYQKQIGKTANIERAELIESLKKQNRDSEIQTELIKFNSRPKNALTGLLYKDYIEDMNSIQYYAYINRLTILKEIVDKAGLTLQSPHTINSTHNYIDTDWDIPILRKGAVSARKDEEVIIPFNMRDGVVIARGLGNPDWNYSAPHGAGRKMSRRQAFKLLSLDKFKDDMKGVYSESVNRSTLDEAPEAYKSFEEVYNLILNETITDPVMYKPVYNYKHHN